MKPLLDTHKGVCYICGGYGSDKHHIYLAANRKHSETWGAYVYLCRHHHEKVHSDKKLKRWLQTEAQEAFESIYGHEKFMETFGRNYIGT